MQVLGCQTSVNTGPGIDIAKAPVHEVIRKQQSQSKERRQDRIEVTDKDQINAIACKNAERSRGQSDIRGDPVSFLFQEKNDISGYDVEQKYAVGYEGKDVVDHVLIKGRILPKADWNADKHDSDSTISMDRINIVTKSRMKSMTRTLPYPGATSINGYKSFISQTFLMSGFS